MKDHFQLIVIQLGQLEFLGRFQRLFRAAVHALRTIYALRQVNLAFIFLRGYLAYSDGSGRTILHAHLAADAFLGIEFQLTTEPLGHPGPVAGIILGSGFLKDGPQNCA
jgi:hypothetical protein